MSKLGRNDPCPCGSGKKYKKCCLPSQIPPNPQSTQHPAFSDPKWIVEYTDLDIASNNVVDLIHQGNLDEAEKAAHKLLSDYPEVHDGLERLAMVYKARGDHSRAVDMYQRTLDFTLDKGDDYDEEMREYFRQTIAELKMKIRPKPNTDK